jgi:hypothetical protein
MIDQSTRRQSHDRLPQPRRKPVTTIGSLTVMP